MTTQTKPIKDVRTARLASALRDNLKKRKAQLRGRAAEDEPVDASRQPPSAKP